jgi:PAS domain S-box-containing protein
MEFSIYFPPEYLRAGLLVSLLSVWVLVGLFAYLNRYTKRRYFTVWTAAWLFYGLWLALAFPQQAAPDVRLIAMVRQWCVGVSATFLFWGSLVFMGQRQRQTTFALFLLFLLTWSYLAIFHLHGSLWARIPVFAVLGLASFRTAWCFVTYRRKQPYLGASLLTVGLALWGVYLGGYPFWESDIYLQAGSFFFCGVLQLFIAVSMIVLVLEETRRNLARLEASQRTSEQACRGLQNRVRSTEERYQRLFEQASDGIVITDDSLPLNVLELNQQARRLLGLHRFEHGEPSFRSFLEGALPNGAAPGGGAASERHPVHGTFCLVATDGTKTPVELEGSRIEFEGEPAWQFAFREVTESVRLEQQLRQAEKLSALGQMISGVAHELNTPLAIIKGYLELVLSRDPLPAQALKDLRKAADESSHAAKLVGNFLSFAREQPRTRETTDLNRLVEAVADRYRLQTGAKPVRIELQLAPDLPATLADPDKLEQVVDNLISNARYAAARLDQPGLVRLTTELAEGTLRLLVEDDGPGVPEHLASKIFEPFFTTKPVGEGTGLGLSISHSIVSEHQGRLYQQASRLGGACFVVELPWTRPVSQAPSSAAKVVPAPLPAATKRAGRPAKVLIVDDEQPLADMLQQIVQYLGHEAVVCLSPLSALEALERSDFDVVFSDYRMPQMDGQQFFHRLQDLKPHLASRVVFLTGDVANEDTRAFLSSVKNATITKPFHLQMVETTIDDALSAEQKAA